MDYGRLPVAPGDLLLIPCEVNFQLGYGIYHVANAVAGLPQVLGKPCIIAELRLFRQFQRAPGLFLGTFEHRLRRKKIASSAKWLKFLGLSPLVDQHLSELAVERRDLGLQARDCV